MTQLKKIDIRKLDGKLLLVFRELLRRRRASDAAEHLGLTQSAISHSLARLRQVFSDPLFVRRAHGLDPTRRALELGPKIENLIDLTSSLLHARGFDASTSERRFTIAAPQYVVATVGSELLSAVHRRAPQVSLTFRDIEGLESAAALRSGEIDAAIGRIDAALPGLRRTVLYSDRFCVAARKGHPHIEERIDLMLYCSTGSIFAAGPPESPGSPGMPSPALVSTRAVVAHWITALTLVSQSDCIATCPRRLAERYRQALDLQVLEPPALVRKAAPKFVPVRCHCSQMRASLGWWTPCAAPCRRRHRSDLALRFKEPRGASSLFLHGPGAVDERVAATLLHQLPSTAGLGSIEVPVEDDLALSVERIVIAAGHLAAAEAYRGEIGRVVTGIGADHHAAFDGTVPVLLELDIELAGPTAFPGAGPGAHELPTRRRISSLTVSNETADSEHCDQRARQPASLHHPSPIM
jgi:DNA-binding transcriptional LysR family regulator